MEKAIHQILETNNRVIVPEFGAFIVKQRKPLTIIFNEFLQYNDGMLIDHISNTEGCSRDEAKQQIEGFVKRVHNELTKNGSCELGKLGVMQKNAAGKITISTKADKAAPQAMAKSKVEVPSESKNEVELEVQESNEDSPLETTETPIAEKPASKEPESKEIVDEETSKAPVKESPTASITSKTEKAPTPIATTYSKSKRKKQNILLWTMVIVVNAVLIGYFILTDQFKGLSFESDETISEELHDVPLFEESIMDTTHPEEAEFIEDPKSKAPEITPHSMDCNHYVVAGVFREEANANKLVEELKEQGYNAEKFGKIGSMYAVSYDCFATKPEADRLLIKLQGSIDPEAWIRTIKK